MKDEKPKICATCKHVRAYPHDEDRIICSLKDSSFHRANQHKHSVVWIISLFSGDITSCSYWEKQSKNHNLLLRLKGEDIPKEKWDNSVMLSYIDPLGNVLTISKENLNAKIWRDQNTYTVPYL